MSGANEMKVTSGKWLRNLSVLYLSQLRSNHQTAAKQ